MSDSSDRNSIYDQSFREIFLDCVEEHDVGEADRIKKVLDNLDPPKDTREILNFIMMKVRVITGVDIAKNSTDLSGNVGLNMRNGAMRIARNVIRGVEERSLVFGNLIGYFRVLLAREERAHRLDRTIRYEIRPIPVLVYAAFELLDNDIFPFDDYYENYEDLTNIIYVVQMGRVLPGGPRIS